jgi:hypothetical protein
MAYCPIEKSAGESKIYCVPAVDYLRHPRFVIFPFKGMLYKDNGLPKSQQRNFRRAFARQFAQDKYNRLTMKNLDRNRPTRLHHHRGSSIP